MPSRAIDWFTLLQENKFVGLVLLNVIDLINYALVGLIFLALYGALKETNMSAMVVATTFGFVGIAVYFASNQAFAMLSLSDRYASATTDTQRALFLAAGEALLAIDNPGLVYQGAGNLLSLLLVILAGLIISVVMLRSTVFNRASAYAGIIAIVLALGYFVALLFAPSIVWLPPTLSAPFRLIWYVLIALQLFRLGASASRDQLPAALPEPNLHQ